MSERTTGLRATQPSVPSLRDYEEERTIIGLAPMRPKLDSREIATETLLVELAAKSQQAKAAEELAARLTAELESARLVKIAATGPTEKQRRKAALHAAVIKVLVAAAGLLGAVTTYLAVRNATVIPPRVDSAEERTKIVETATSTDHETQLRILEYLRAEQARRDCLDAQIGSALARGTGHRISGVQDPGSWIESAMPTRRPVMLWDRAVWYPSSPCAPEPHVP